MANSIKKFRAWDGLNRRFTYWTINDLCTWGTKNEMPSPFDEWMSWTGLLDKNSKEIYEGDILGYWGGNKNGAKWIVGWDDNKSGWSAVYGETDLTNLGESMSGRPAFKLSKKVCEKKEITGNIWENSSLLKD